MAVTIPKIEELTIQILNNKATEFGISVTELGDTIVAESKAEAATLYQFYLTLGKVQNNVYPDISDNETLLRYGQGLLGRSPAPAVAGVYEIEVTGTIGSTISAGITFKSNDDSSSPGYLYVVDFSYTLVATTDYLSVRALTPGLESKLIVGDNLTSTQPLTSIESGAVVNSIITDPSESESVDSYREDVLAALRLEPQGGSPSDYRLWSLDVPEVRTVYPYLRLNDIGSLDIYVEATPENSDTIVGQPTQAILDDVYKKPSGGDPESGAIVYNESEQRGRRPLGIFDIESIAVTPIPVDLNFTGLTNLGSVDSIKTATNAFLYDVRPFIAGAESLLNKNDILTLGQVISVVIAVLNQAGGTYSDLEMTVNSVVSTTYTFDFGYYPYLRNVNNNGLPV